MNKKLMVLSLLLFAMGLQIESSSATVMGTYRWNGQIPDLVLREHGMFTIHSALAENTTKTIAKSMTSHEFTHLHQALSGNNISGISHNPTLMKSCLPSNGHMKMDRERLEFLRKKWAHLHLAPTETVKGSAIPEASSRKTEATVSAATASFNNGFSRIKYNPKNAVIGLGVGSVTLGYLYTKYYAKPADIENHGIWNIMKDSRYATGAGIAALVGLSYGGYKAYKNGYFSKMNPFRKAKSLEQDTQNTDDAKE